MPFKIYPNWDFWLENIPSGNPDFGNGFASNMPIFFFSAGIRGTVPPRFLLQTCSNTTTPTRNHYCNHFPTLSLEHLHLSLPGPTLLTFRSLPLHTYLGLQIAYFLINRFNDKYACKIAAFWLKSHFRLLYYITYVDSWYFKWWRLACTLSGLKTFKNIPAMCYQNSKKTFQKS
jgi:hypothetical protein